MWLIQIITENHVHNQSVIKILYTSRMPQINTITVYIYITSHVTCTMYMYTV